MTPTRTLRGPAASLALLLALGACTPDAGRPDRAATAFLQIIRAELARPADGPALETLRAGTQFTDPFLRQTAVRALGRLEDPDRIPDIRVHLSDPTPTVRVAAANALAQAVHRAPGSAVLPLLLERIDVEENPNVRAVLAQSLGRLTLEGAEQQTAVDALLGMSSSGSGDAPIATMMGVALGLETLARTTRGAALGDRARGRLRNLIAYDLMESRDGLDGPRIRLLALAALASSSAVDASVIEPALRDPDPRVRAVAAGLLGRVNELARAEFLRRGLGDPSVRVRIATVRQLMQEERTELFCDWLNQVATVDETQAVRVLAMDALAAPCSDRETQIETLLGAASRLGPETVDGWQVPAHALVSLAQVDGALANSQVDGYASHPNPFVRGYAARAADVLDRQDVLTALMDDPAANVRSLVLPMLAGRSLAQTPEWLRAQLEDDDPQLLMTTSRLLVESGGDPAAGEAALAAFERISAAQRETWRDSRMALLTAIEAITDRSSTERLEPFLQDYDPVVAGRVAALLQAWTGRPHTATPRLMPQLGLPSASELRDLSQTRVTLHMRKGGEIVIEPLPFLATSNAHRFVRLAREGYFDGLTFHRWAPNFVIQGGSPGANEYSGDARFSRDEIGLLPHWRGTVGLSTRGHDTGDGQIFINIVDNVRLNHDYTIYGILERGVDVVDRMLEGDVIARAEVTRLP